jgi:4-amino-4-deoxy-L-arabinose transferase-like glycosyltransferase
MSARERARRWAPEIALAILASLVFLGFLGSVDLWGKREQRAAAEALDTVDRQHWLVAEIQGRPRLEKPPLPRWTIAGLVVMTGRRDEWIVRLPSVLSALGMVGVAYALGRRIGGRAVGLASGLALTSIPFFISELRQAGNDGPLAFFTALALYAAWRRLHGDDRWEAADRWALEDNGEDEPPPAARLGARGWATLMYVALGLGFLCKGPIILILAAVTLVPYLAISRALRSGLKALFEPRGLTAFLLLAACWPVLVLFGDWNAWRVWWLEMGQKAGAAGIKHHRQRFLAEDWPGMTAPWTFVIAWGLFLPFLRGRKSERRGAWFVWWWSVGNLAMFCLWSVAKPNYYLPCMPGVALLTGMAWVRICRKARGALSIEARRSRRMLQGHWLVLLLIAGLAPVVIGQKIPSYLGWTLVGGVVLGLSVVASILAWRRGRDAATLAALAGGVAAASLIAYGALAPRLNPTRSHRELAARLDEILPPGERTVRFYRALDEGLWFYLRDRALRPVPGSQPKYNKDVDLYDEVRTGAVIWDDAARLDRDRQILIDWLRDPGRDSHYVLIRAKVYDLFAPKLAGLATPVYREQGLERNELMLLRAEDPAPVAATPGRDRR